MTDASSRHSSHRVEPPRRPFGFGRGHRSRAMGMPVERPKDFAGTLRRLLTYIKPRAWQLAAVFLMAALGTVFNILSPKIMGEATTALFDGYMLKRQGAAGSVVDFQAIGRILATLAALYVASSAFSYAQGYIMAGLAQRIVLDMRRDVNRKLGRLPLGFFDARPHGEILSRVINDVENISSTLQQSLTQAVTAVVTLTGVVAMMLIISPSLAVVTMVMLPLSAATTAAIARRSQRFFKAQQRALGHVNGHVEEMFTGHRVVKGFSLEGESVDRFRSLNRDLYDAGWKAQFISGIVMPLMHFINNIGYVVVSVVGGIFVTRQALTVGDVQALLQYSRKFSQPITQIAGVVNIIQSTLASAERVFQLLDEAEKVPDPAAPQELTSPKGRVRFHNVAFRYRPDVPLIENLNITVEPGQVVAVVGPTGAGKTTLVNLLMRFYEIDDGAITIDGVDIRSMTRRHLRSMTAMVLQDAWLFHGTIRDNIAYGREGATEEEIIAAARAAHAHPFIRTLPDGYDTVLNEEATNVSQGQRQLLTIARALLADPVILILDEATSSVDTRTEHHIQKAMQTLMRGRTSIVIAHRLSTIQDADLILVMDKGRVIEQGTHEELLAANGFYAELYRSQFAGGGELPAAAPAPMPGP